MKSINKSCRLIHAHVHRYIDSGTSHTYAKAQNDAPQGMRLLRIRWLPAQRRWQTCYIDEGGK